MVFLKHYLFVPFLWYYSFLSLFYKFDDMKDIPLLKINGLVQSMGKGMYNGDNFSIFEIKDAPERLKQQDPFRNDFYAIAFILKGTLKLAVDFTDYTVSPGMVYFITPGQVSSTIKVAEEGFGILFKKDFLTHQGAVKWLQGLPIFHQVHSAPYFNISMASHERLTFYLQGMLQEYQSTAPYKYDSIKANLTLTLIYLSRLYKMEQGEEHKEHNHTLLRFESLIDEHHQEIKSVKEYAEMLYMTPQNLNRITKKVTGKNASDLINDKVLIEIKRYLLFTDKSIEEIAYQLNFFDNSYFTKYFKKATGMTPKAFRNSHSS